MAISGVGALVSGLVFHRHTWRMLMLAGCLAIFEIIFMDLSYKLGWGRIERRLIGVFLGLAIVAISFKIRKSED